MEKLLPCRFGDFWCRRNIKRQKGKTIKLHWVWVCSTACIFFLICSTLPKGLKLQIILERCDKVFRLRWRPPIACSWRSLQAEVQLLPAAQWVPEVSVQRMHRLLGQDLSWTHTRQVPQPRKTETLTVPFKSSHMGNTKTSLINESRNKICNFFNSELEYTIQ